MRLLSLTLATTSILCMAAVFKDDAATKEEEKLQGTWKLASLEINGKQVPEEAIKEGRITVKDGKYTFLLGDTILEVKYKLNSNRKLKTIDISFPNGQQPGKTVHGIYELAGDSFKICRSMEPEKERPTKFTTRPNSGLMLVVWHRDQSAEHEKPEKVVGVVTLNGKPLGGATVKLVPVEAAGRTASGVTDAKGSFQATTFAKGDGVLPGEYKILVTPYVQTKADKTDPEAAALKRLMEKAPKKAQRSRLHPAYGNLATTPLRFKMPSQSGELNLNLQTGR